MKYLPTLLVLAFSCLFWSQGQAQEIATGVGLICNTADEVRDYAAKFDGDTNATLEKVNASSPVCGVMGVAYVMGEEVGTVQTKDGPAIIAKIAVVAINLGMGWQRSPPIEQFTLFLVQGRDT